MNILNKFEKVEIKNESRISEQDLSFCKQEETKYRATIALLESTVKAYEELVEKDGYTSYSSEIDPGGYLREYDDVRHIIGRIEKIKLVFLDRICSYFTRSYQISIDRSKISDKYETTISYTNIIDEIVEQLDGFTFSEKAVNELKENIRKEIYSYNKTKVNKKKITIYKFIDWENFDLQYSNSYKIHYNCNSFTHLLKALTHYETAETETSNALNNVYKKFNEGSRSHDIFSKIELDFYNKIKSIKAFKNGRLDIEFDQSVQAQQFFNEYLNSTKTAA